MWTSFAFSTNSKSNKVQIKETAKLKSLEFNILYDITLTENIAEKFSPKFLHLEKIFAKKKKTEMLNSND